MNIDFSNKSPLTKIKELLKTAKEEVKKAEDGITWDEVNNPLDDLSHEIGLVLGVSAHLNSVKYNEEDSNEYEQIIPIISDFYNELGSNKNLFNAYKRLSKQDLTTEQKYILKEGIKGFELAGISLSRRGTELLSKINKELSVLQNEFGKNAMMATNEWEIKVSLEDLDGVDASNIYKFKEGNSYLINLQAPTYMEVMTNVDSETIREQVYTAYISRASDVGITSVEFDNKPIMDEILRLRKEKANVLGFKDYASLSVESKMVDSTDTVLSFLNDLIDRAIPQAKKEFEELSSFAKKTLNPWDLMYYSNKLKESKYNYDKQEVTDYLSESKVMAGLFKTINDLYDIDISVSDDENDGLYNEDVRVIEFMSKGKKIGKVYLDLYARENKRAGAWMDDYAGLSSRTSTIPTAFVVGNFNKAVEGETYYELDEVVTLFHEFGHALHHIMTVCEYPSVAGISGVPWDGVELPSQYMENYVYEKSIFKSMTEHRDTKESIPDSLYKKVIESKNFQSGMGLVRQCSFSLWDMETHMTSDDTYDVLSKIDEKTSLMDKVPENRFLNSFLHIFAGGYDAGYYSYKWAEVMSADAYSYINGDKQKSDDFRSMILEVGGSLDFFDQYKKFRGQEPDLKAVLKLNGIN